jgi:hypothetical protein
MNGAKKILSVVGRVVLPPGAAVATFWAVDSNWQAITLFIYQFLPVKWSPWFIDNIVTLPAWVTALVAALIVLTGAVYFRNWQLGEKLTPKLHLEFDPNSSACIRDVQLKDGSPAVYVRVLPVCKTEAMVDNCKGHLNAVYHRQTETDKWQPTNVNERLTLTWANVATPKSAVMPRLKQHLDVLVATGWSAEHPGAKFAVQPARNFCGRRILSAGYRNEWGRYIPSMDLLAGSQDRQLAQAVC